MLAIQSMINKGLFRIYFVQYCIGIGLMASREDDDFLFLSHILEEVNCIRIVYPIETSNLQLNQNQWSNSMGQEQPKPMAKTMTLEDNIIEMKIQCKQLERASKKAEKQSANYQKKAKEALKKNNEQGAKMYLMSAASKRSEAMSTQRIALKMQFMCGQIKTMKSNEMMANNFAYLAQIVNQQAGNFNFQNMSNQLEMFNNRMDQMMINNKMMTEIMNTNEAGTDMVVEEMKHALQEEIAMEEKNKLMEQENVQFQKQKAENDKFLDDLKGL